MSDVAVVVALVMAVGLLGTLIPMLPGLPLVWAGALLFGLVEGMGAAGLLALGAITLLGVVGVVAKLVLPQRRTAVLGVPRASLLVAAAAGLVGFFVVPVVGLPLGAAAGLLVAERRRTGTWDAAWAATRGAVVGYGVGTLVELGAGIAMVAVWAAWALLAA